MKQSTGNVFGKESPSEQAFPIPVPPVQARDLSFVSQRHHRIDLGCPTGGKVAGKQRHNEEN